MTQQLQQIIEQAWDNRAEINPSNGSAELRDAVSHVLAELEISCLPADLPEFINVDLANIDVGHSIHVADLALPKGVTAVTHGANQTVATASVPAGQVSAEAATEAAAEGKPAKGKK